MYRSDLVYILRNNLYILAVECPTLPLIGQAELPVCSNGQNFKSICSYNCYLGYGMPQGVSKTVVCRSNKTWLYKGDPECIGIRDTDAFRYSTVF